MMVKMCLVTAITAKRGTVQIAKNQKGAFAVILSIVWIAGISQTVLVVTQSFAKNASHRAMNIRSATNVRDVFAMSFAQNMKYRLIAIAVRRVAVITVMRNIIRMRIGLLVIDAATASVTIATRRKAYYTQYKCATVVTRATVVIVGNLLRSKGMKMLRVKRMKKTRIALDVSN
mmetsp:Transcript_12077/g.20450  ORF Transcript_12077/g.20450 Transcript_12077/m.20450 type:complete len:174 (+) Transcript_12077:475-996(+)